MIPNEAAWARQLIARIIEACPRRKPTSEDERRAQEMIADVYREQHPDLRVDLLPFRFNDNLYANLVLHFGVGLAGSLVGRRDPRLAFALHALCAGSYALDSTRKAFLLRRLFPFKPSVNLLATAPADTDEPALRVVFLSHTDAAFTGWLFEPWFIDAFYDADSPLSRGLQVATASQAALAALAALRTLSGRRRLLWPLAGVLGIPAALVALLNTQIVLKNEIVPGANDNLSGVAAGLLLAHRLLPDKPDDVELVFASTGCEEASLGGADALTRRFRGVWDPKRTVIIGIDSLTGGDLRYFEEGEIFPLPMAPQLRRAIEETVAEEPRFAEVTPFQIPVGATDGAAFMVQGFDAVTFGCVNPARGAPEHYHQSSDTAANFDADKLPFSLDVVEAVTRRLWDRRGGL